MDSKRRNFLKQGAMAAAGVAVASTALNAAEPKKDLKSNSGKKAEILYQETQTWKTYYKDAE
ncbi:MAG: twin-arginine translocation signal domain-containing protein [Campylobacteraceae bacterium]|nr:twin-arginine translocation signal domain-containing protein [Campylobacteraceae bacterium]